jgi:diguanylate cyclase (GGDEF)-like protein
VSVLKEKTSQSEAMNAFNTTEKKDELLRLVIELLTGTKPVEESALPPHLKERELFLQLYAMISDIRLLSNALSKGELHQFVYSKGFIISNLKALQSNLRHLTWQTQKLAEGDFSQRVDFLGEFSTSFNIMAQKLEDNSYQLRQLASTDTLTQLSNRLTLDSFLEEAFECAKRNNSELSVLMFDIDHFKRVNDTYGHGAGDQVLVKVSQLLSKVFRADDIFARYGGEEFVAVLPGCPAKQAAAIGVRAIKAVEEAEIEISHGVPMRVTVSGGVSEILRTDACCTDIVKRSDAALYRAKQTGRNRICVG